MELFIQFITSDIGQLIGYASGVVGLLLTLFTLLSVLSIKRRIRTLKKRDLCVRNVKRIVEILEKNKGNWSQNPSDMDERIRNTNEQIYRNSGIFRCLINRLSLSEKRIRANDYLHFLSRYREILIDLENIEL